MPELILPEGETWKAVTRGAETLRWMERTEPGRWDTLRWKYHGEQRWRRPILAPVYLSSRVETALLKSIVAYSRLVGVDLDLCDDAERRWAEAEAQSEFPFPFTAYFDGNISSQNIYRWTNTTITTNTTRSIS